MRRSAASKGNIYSANLVESFRDSHPRSLSGCVWSVLRSGDGLSVYCLSLPRTDSG